VLIFTMPLDIEPADVTVCIALAGLHRPHCSRARGCPDKISPLQPHCAMMEAAYPGAINSLQILWVSISCFVP